MKVLSLFDGISCGMVALEREGIPVERYVAYEIDEDAIKVSKHNYPMIEQKGDVFEAEHKEGEFDLLIGGSPCTHWSIARGNGTRETTASGIGWELFSQYARALKEAKPRWFLYENNATMSDEIKECISRVLGCEPVMINSADFSAQKRERYYWTNIPILPWAPVDTLFSDIMDEHYEKSRSIEKYKDTYRWSKDGMCISWDTSGKGYYSQASRARKPEQKWNTVCANRAESKGNVWLGNDTIRLVTMSELEKLQTLPVGYTSCLKNKEKRGKGIGNGWTVDVIAHIFKGLKEVQKPIKLCFPIPEKPANLNDVSNSLFALDRDENTQILVEVSKGETEADGERIAEYEFELKDNTVHVMVHNGEVINFVRKEAKSCGK